MIVNESSCTAAMALLGGSIEDSILMPDPLPSVASSSLTTSTTSVLGTRNISRASLSLDATSSQPVSLSDETHRGVSCGRLEHYQGYMPPVPLTTSRMTWRSSLHLLMFSLLPHHSISYGMAIMVPTRKILPLWTKKHLPCCFLHLLEGFHSQMMERTITQYLIGNLVPLPNRSASCLIIKTSALALSSIYAPGDFLVF